jgi:hypothetical protein
LLFDAHPFDVIRTPDVSPYKAQRLRETELGYPIDALALQEKWWILDGVHRIARHFVLNMPTIAGRLHDESVISAIRLD